MLIYRLLPEKEWYENKNKKIYHPRELETDGFIHFSFKHQLIQVANAIYKKYDKLIVLEIETEKLEHLEALKLEDLYGLAEDYPHLYNELNISAISDRFEIRKTGSGFELPN